MRPWWKPLWTRQAGMRALRATLVVPGLFAICLEVIGDPKCLGSDSQGRIHRGGGGEKRAVDHK